MDPIPDPPDMSEAAPSTPAETTPRHVLPDAAAPPPAPEDSARPDITRLTSRLHGPLGTIAVATSGLLTLALFYALNAAQAFFLPLVIALLFNFLLSPIVAWLKRLRIPAPVGAAILLVCTVGLLGVGIYQLFEPAAAWVEQAPQRMQEIENKLGGVRESLEKVEQTTEQIQNLADNDSERDEQVQVQETTLSVALRNITVDVLVGVVVLIFLLYFLLASGDLFLRKLVRVLPILSQKRNAVRIIRHTEDDLSHYFLTVALINAGLGAAVGLALYLLGMPNPVLWGVLVAILNFIPYAGGLIGVIVITFVALVTFDSLTDALWPPLAYLVLNMLEAYAVTPAILGRRLTLNPVAVFISIIFWGWLWGVAGAILAVPILVSFKIVCDNIESLAAVSEFLGR